MKTTTSKKEKKMKQENEIGRENRRRKIFEEHEKQE